MLQSGKATIENELINNNLYFNFAIGVNDTLTELDLSWNHIRLTGATEVAKSLKVTAVGPS